MRLLQIQLELDADHRSAVDLHPMITVVSGFDAVARGQLIDAVRALPTGGAAGHGGLVESHGVLFDLSAETLQLFGLHLDLDPVVRRSDLPASADDTGSVQRITTEQFLADTGPGAHPELDAARKRQRSARETLAILREATDRARREHTEAASAARLAAAALAAATVPEPAETDPTGQADGDAPAPLDRTELEARHGTLSTELARVDQGLAELSGLDIRPIEVLLEAIRDPSPVELVPSERASELADHFGALQQQVDALEQRLEQQGRGTATALAQLEAARTELAAAERAMRKPSLSPDDVVELEAAHAMVLAAESGMSGLRRRGGQKRFDEAQTAERAILDRVGFPTWSAYVMGAGLMSIDPIAEQRLDEARQQLDAVEGHWAEVANDVEADPEHSGLLDQLEAVYLEAFDLLGGDDEQNDLEVALRAFNEPKREVTTQELVDALAYQLALVGLDLGTNEPGIDRTLMAADAFLAEVQTISDRVDELQHERDQLSADLADNRRLLERLDADGASARAIDITDAALAADRSAPVDIEALLADLDRANEDEHDYADQLEARLALVDASTRVEAVASSRLIRIASELAVASGPADLHRSASDPAFEIGADDVDDGPESVEFYLLSRVAALRAASFAGSVPIVLDDPLADLAPPVIIALLNKLEPMSESVQIIYITDDPTVIEWTTSIGLHRGAVVSAPGQLV
jgi:hypothetical protein